MPSLFDPQASETFRSRIDRLTANSQPLWGKMNVGQMVVHCTAQMRLASGELTAAPFNTPARWFPLKQLIVYVLPVPKSVPTLPELRDPLTTGWEKDRDELKNCVARLAAQDRGKPWPPHAAFGELTPSQWGRLIWKHLDHHLRQFGA